MSVTDMNSLTPKMFLSIAEQVSKLHTKEEKTKLSASDMKKFVKD